MKLNGREDSIGDTFSFQTDNYLVKYSADRGPQVISTSVCGITAHFSMLEIFVFGANVGGVLSIIMRPDFATSIQSDSLQRLFALSREFCSFYTVAANQNQSEKKFTALRRNLAV